MSVDLTAGSYSR